MKKSYPVIFLALLVFSCKPDGKKGEQLFTLLPPSSTNVHFKNQLSETEQSNIIQYLYFNNGAGVAAGDINNDGLVDLYFTSNQRPDKLYLNKGNFKFEDITETAGVAGTGEWKTGVTMADVNGDGLLDIYVCQVGNYKNYHGKNQLFINQGNLTFKEEAREYGLDFQGFSTQAAFFDYDMDGDLDMYLQNHSVHTSRSYGNSNLRFDHDSLSGGRLFRNDVVNGKHVFHDVTREAGIYDSQVGYGLGVNICDINNDGFPDVYVSNDFHENDYLYINNKNGTFSEKLTDMIAHTSRSSMGNDVGDINNDGLLDIVVLDMLPDNEKIRKQSGGEDDYELSEMKLKDGYNHQFVRNTLQLNLGGGMFSEIGLYAGIASTDWSWSPLLCDVDNDGLKDLFITNGIYRRANDLDYVKFLTGGNKLYPSRDLTKYTDKQLYERMPLYPGFNYIFKNNGDLTFSDMDKSWGFNTRSFSNGSTYADLDNDGDLDLITNNINDPASIYRNNARQLTGNHFLSIVLKGNGMNTRGIGARVTLYSGGHEQVADQFPTRGFLSAVSDVLHFGLGKTAKIDSVLVRWPDLSEEIIKNVPVDTTITLDIANSSKPIHIITQDDVSEKIFSPALVPGLEFKHIEDRWVDFYREQLIPHSLSAEGPALAVADINGDGLQDLFIGGAKGQPSKIFVQEKNGSFKALDVPLLNRERFADDVDAAFFDADGDGDEDLYIVRGGNELNIGNPLLCDLLLINDGKGGFSKGILPFMSHNGSCVRTCDFDGDGDIDLFVGSRSVPGAYGLSPEQFLLENDGHGHFNIVTGDRTKDIKNAGMVTDAAWMDWNKDGKPDLIITGEWMNVSIYKNDDDAFSDVTRAAGLDETSGWWNCISVADVDGDSNMDLVCGNLGLNSYLKASVKEPVKMYLNDFDNNGSLDQIICTYQDEISYPFASLDELSAQIKSLDKKFPRYSDFGGKSIEDIFGKSAIDKSLVKTAVLFESCLFHNKGNGIFESMKLPKEAQFSTIRNIVVKDINNDGKQDLILAGNDYAVRPSYGRYDASYGWCMPGDSHNAFYTLMPVKSGLRINGDARKIATIVIAGKQYLLAAVNNGELQVFQFLK
jgi:enediyne biosynthesis protein E4